MAYALDHESPDGNNGAQLRSSGQLQPDAGSEVEIGTILMRVQQFADETARQAELQANAVVEAARVEAARIVEEARQQAAGLAVSARPVIAPDAVTNLSAALDEFASTNRFLVGELTQLRDALSGTPSSALPPGYAQPPAPPSLPVRGSTPTRSRRSNRRESDGSR
jgi:hypothetical protein